MLLAARLPAIDRGLLVRHLRFAAGEDVEVYSPAQHRAVKRWGPPYWLPMMAFTHAVADLIDELGDKLYLEILDALATLAREVKRGDFAMGTERMSNEEQAATARTMVIFLRAVDKALGTNAADGALDKLRRHGCQLVSDDGAPPCQ
jgi:hypothetical protein